MIFVGRFSPVKVCKERRARFKESVCWDAETKGFIQVSTINLFHQDESVVSTLAEGIFEMIRNGFQLMLRIGI